MAEKDYRTCVVFFKKELFLALLFILPLVGWSIPPPQYSPEVGQLISAFNGLPNQVAACKVNSYCKQFLQLAKVAIDNCNTNPATCETNANTLIWWKESNTFSINEPAMIRIFYNGKINISKNAKSPVSQSFKIPGFETTYVEKFIAAYYMSSTNNTTGITYIGKLADYWLDQLMITSSRVPDVFQLSSRDSNNLGAAFYDSPNHWRLAKNSTAYLAFLRIYDTIRSLSKGIDPNDLDYCKTRRTGTAASSGFAAGDGSATNPFKICTLAQYRLLRVKKLLDKNLFFQFMADIDARGVDSLSPDSVGSTFSGTLDGNGFTLFVGKIKRHILNPAGIIGPINEATIKNLKISVDSLLFQEGPPSYEAGLIGSRCFNSTFENIAISARIMEAPALCGQGANIKAKNIFVHVDRPMKHFRGGALFGSLLDGSDYFGEPAYDGENTTLENIWIRGSILGYRNAGGLVGEIDFPTKTLFIKNVFLNASVGRYTPAGASVPVGIGGLVGESVGNLSVDNVYMNGGIAAETTPNTSNGIISGITKQNKLTNPFKNIFFKASLAQTPNLDTSAGQAIDFNKITSVSLPGFDMSIWEFPAISVYEKDSWSPSIIPIMTLINKRSTTSKIITGDN